MDLKSVHKPLKEKYRSERGSSRITLGAKASQEDTLISCSVDIGRAIHQAEAHAGVGGTGGATELSESQLTEQQPWSLNSASRPLAALFKSSGKPYAAFNDSRVPRSF